MKIKSTVFALLIIHFSILLYGQKVVLSPIKFKVIYCEFENPVEIVASNYSCDELIIKSSYSTIKKQDSCKYLIRPYSGVVKEKIIVLRKKDKDTIPIDTLCYNIKRLPDPIVSFEKSYKDKKGFFPNKLIAITKNFDYEVSYTVISFAIVLMRNEVVIDSIAVKGNVLGLEYIDIGKKVISGDKLFIENIHVQREDGEILEINSINLKIDEN